MASLYADYLTERTNDKILENPEGFATYRFLDNAKCYIIDIYVRPEFRSKGLAGQMLATIVLEAKERGCTELLGTVVPGTRGSKESIQGLFYHGMELLSAENNVIILRKEI